MPKVEIGGLLRCCLDFDEPVDATLGTTIPCKHCQGGGVTLVAGRDGEPVWQATWVTKGFNWRRGPSQDTTHKDR